MKKILFMAALLLGVIAVGCSDDETPSFGGIYGIITDTQTGEPIRSVYVVLSPGNVSTVTGGDGHYEFTDLEAKQYKIQASANGYATNSRQISVVPGSNVSGDMTLTPVKELSDVKLSATQLNFDKTHTELVLELFNTGNAGTVSWNITGIDAAWLTVSPMSGSIETGKSVSLKVKADRSRVTADETTFFTVNAAGGSQAVRVLIATGNGGGGDDPVDPDQGDVINGLYAHYTFENSTRNTVDGAVDGQAIHSPAYVEGMQGTKAIKFSVSDKSYINIPEGMIDKRQFTISFWVKGINDGHLFHVVQSSGNRAFSLTMSAGQLKFVATHYNNYYQFDNRKPFTHPSLDSGWHQITLASDFNNITYATVTTKLYIDGQYCDVITEDCNPFSQDSSSTADYGVGIKFQFGGDFQPSNSGTIDGIGLALDNLRVYNSRCLTDKEIRRLYNYEK